MLTNGINSMPPWLTHLSSAQRIESKSHSSRWVQLATIGIDKSPRVRTVVFRGWSKNYEMEIYTDKRSQKYHELDLNNEVEICWVFSKAKCQFRFRGTSLFYLDKDHLRHWQKLSNKSKSMWMWPCPGEPFKFDQTNKFSVNTNEDISNNFAVLKIDITYVDQLLLHKPIHTRRNWIRKKNWIENRINP